MKLLQKAFFICAGLAVLVPALVSAQSTAAKSGIVSVQTIAESFGDGEKVSSVVIEYPKNIDQASLSVNGFSVEGRKIVSVMTSSKAERPSVSETGRYVILNLEYENRWDATNGQMPPRPQTQADDGKGQPDFSAQPDVIIDLTATVTQTGEVKAADGTVYAPSAAVKSTHAEESVIRDFIKQTYSDTETGCTIPYFVYLPAGYSKSQKYPLVFFVPDASADSGIDTATLTQGNGATIWATAEEQKKHPAIVIAVQYPRSLVQKIGALTTDDNKWSTGLTLVYNLLQHVISTYSVDQTRIYGTGQSQGCMTNIALSDKYPSLFAAQLLVAGQWNIEEMAAMKNKKLWIVVCAGDTKAYPGMNSATALWESLGTKVARSSMWNPKASAPEMADNVKAVRAQNCSINYTVFEGGSHMYTWSIAYNIEGIRNWLFEQKK